MRILLHPFMGGLAWGNADRVWSTLVVTWRDGAPNGARVGETANGGTRTKHRGGGAVVAQVPQRGGASTGDRAAGKRRCVTREACVVALGPGERIRASAGTFMRRKRVGGLKMLTTLGRSWVSTGVRFQHTALHVGVEAVCNCAGASPVTVLAV